jgi:hypothetical protein
MRSRHLLTLPLVAALAACAHGLIPGTQVKDTKENREVLAVVQKAVEALGNRDSTTLLSLISPRYFEDNGTPAPDDDYGYTQLKDEVLPKTMARTKEIFLEVQVQDVVIDGNQARVDVRYSSRARMDLPNGPPWASSKDFDRILLAREDGTWKIVGGL